MWGPWFGITIGGVLLVLLLIGIAFGTSALLFPVLIFAGALVVIAIFYGAASVKRGLPAGPGSRPDPVREAAPVTGEGSAPPPDK
jgi:uncharacterized membrane protein